MSEEKETKYCQNCGKIINLDAVICPYCGTQVEKLKTETFTQTNPNVIINNNVSNTQTCNNGRRCNKWVALCLCIFLGFLGGHKFYEGKIASGIIYLLTFGLCGLGVLIDFIVILCRPEYYYA